MAVSQIYEGTAEEIAEQLRVSNLTGRLKAVVTPDDVLAQAESQETLNHSLAALLAEAHRIEPQPPVPSSDPHEAAFGEIVKEKYRKMGFIL